MKELISIFTTAGERLEEVMKIVGETLVGVTEAGDEALVEISATEEEWCNIRTLLAAR